MRQASPLRHDASIEGLSLPASLKAAIREQLLAPEPAGIELETGPSRQAWHVLVAPMMSPGTTARSIVVIADITERNRLDSIRREFVANASHELKTPVAGIRLLAESAATAAADGDDERAADFSRQIAGEVDRLQRLVGDLLDLSRLESLPAPDEMTDLRSAVDNALLSHRSAAESKGLALSADYSAVRDVDVFAACDPTDIAVALDNLLDNAIQYTETGSVTVEVLAKEDEVQMRVSDTGPGIGAEHLPRIFERFYRVDKGRSRDVGGTGLGLALVRHMAERSGGSVSVESEPGVGSAFTLTVPRFRGGSSDR
jgi:two-component system phosphate regulon sensor histidine kinase PhoR